MIFRGEEGSDIRLKMEVDSAINLKKNPVKVLSGYKQNPPPL
jgi:hypothetical protein